MCVDRLFQPLKQLMRVFNIQRLADVCVCVNVLLFPCRKTLKAEMCVCLDTLTEISRHQRSPAVCVVLWLTEELGCHSLQHQLQKLTTHWVSLAGNQSTWKTFNRCHLLCFRISMIFLFIYLSEIEWSGKLGRIEKHKASEAERVIIVWWKIFFAFMWTDVCSRNLTLNDNQVCNVNTI